LDITSFPVTGSESMHSEGMSQVVQPRYETAFIFAAYASSAA
jgi:hypothetical protein